MSLTNFGKRVSSNGSGNQSRTSKSVTRRVADVSVSDVIIPTMRQREVRFRAEGLLPNTRHYPFFDGVRVDKYCYPIPFELGNNWRHAFRNNWDGNNRSSSLAPVYSAIYRPLQPEDWTKTWNPLHGNTEPNPASPSFQGLVSDANGVIEGVFFIPNNEELAFETGTKDFSLYDITAENPEAAASFAISEYEAEGIRRTTTTTIERITTTTRTRIRYKDPIAQTFLVNNDSGIFLTKVGVFFETKDPGNIPVQMQIRPVVEGAPASYDIMPGASKWLNPGDVTVSSNATSETIFEFPKPIYLSPGTEYAIVMITRSFDYNVFISRMGEFPLGVTDRKITKQPYLGSFFRSQNSTIWEPSQLEDLKFNIYRAKFVSSGNAIIENEGTAPRLLPGDPFLFDSGDTTVRVIHPNHGMFINDKITLNFDSDLTYPIQPKSIGGSRTITAVDGTGYTFEADSAASSGGRFGGTSVLAQDQVLMDYMTPSIDIGVPNECKGEIYGKFTTGKSLAGTETPYGKDVSFRGPISSYEKHYFNSPALIADRQHEIDELAGEKSVTLRIDMSTTTDFLSPVVDAERMSITAINNVIDRQDSSATTGFNVPLTFIDETDPTLGSHLAKHITQPVTLTEDAVGLKIMLAANKPNQASFDVYYKTAGEDDDLQEMVWTLIEPESVMPDATDPKTFYEYRYLPGGLQGTLDPFITFQIKIVMKTTNSSRPPSFKDLRVIALTV